MVGFVGWLNGKMVGWLDSWGRSFDGWMVGWLGVRKVEWLDGLMFGLIFYYRKVTIQQCTVVENNGKKIFIGETV